MIREAYETAMSRSARFVGETPTDVANGLQRETPMPAKTCPPPCLQSRVVAERLSPASNTELPAFAPRALRIIVADDDGDERVTLAAILRDEGHEVRTAHRGDAVLPLVDEFAPEAVLLDIGMPGMSGYEVVRRLRERRGVNCPLLVAVTAWKQTSERLLGQIVGFDHYIVKPYSTNELLAVLAPLRTGESEAKGTGPISLPPDATREQRLMAQAVRLAGQEELAAALQVSESQVGAWLNGQESVGQRYLLKLSDYLVDLSNRLAKK